MHCSISVFSDKILKYDDAHMHFKSSCKALMEHLKDFECKQCKGLKTTNLNPKGEQGCFCIYCGAQQSNIFTLRKAGTDMFRKCWQCYQSRRLREGFTYL